MKDHESIQQHGDIIWDIANLLRGPYRPPQYRRVMIPLIVLRRLDCVLESTHEEVAAHHKALKTSGKYKGDNEVETIEKLINSKFKLTFHNTSGFTFAKLLGDPDKLAANLNKFMAGFSSRARQIIGEASTARGQGVTRIEVNGFTDRSGPADYNMQLSIRRANAVAAELVRRGVPRNEIVTRGFGEENNLVPTADGVREPQNRRVEIILK